ncbi:MAG: nitrogen regulation protein NR(I) [Pseudomonadales bacterium]|nr:nitrogen regulation protein NR(I) [Pseudomonadales bacterium]
MNNLNRVWIVDDDSSIRWVLERALGQENLKAECFEDGSKLLAQLDKQPPNVIISDIRMPGTDGFALLKEVHASYPDLPVIIMTAHSDLESAVTSYETGAFEYLPKPFDVDEAVATVKRALLHAQNLADKASGNTSSTSPPLEMSTELIGKAPAMQEVFRAIGRLSQSNITVLIQGQSGTGKELVAKALHKHSPRAAQPFIALNMAAIPKDLVESELFGHVKGAFTGASQQRAGRFEQANGGTLFLDEIGDMPAETQTRLLRVLADGEFYKVGGHAPVQVNVRIIAATHQKLETLVTQGLFREDLYHRLNVIKIQLPKLADRSIDIPDLARLFLNQSARELECDSKILHPDTEAYLCTLPWPGNVRQLENVCRWLTVMASGQDILIQDLPDDLNTKSTSQQAGPIQWEAQLGTYVTNKLAAMDLDSKPLLEDIMPKFERIIINAALAHTSGKKREASILLGWGRNTLTRKLKELDIQSGASE